MVRKASSLIAVPASLLGFPEGSCITFCQQNPLPGTARYRSLLPLRSLFECDFAKTKLALSKGAGHLDLTPVKKPGRIAVLEFFFILA